MIELYLALEQAYNLAMTDDCEIEDLDGEIADLMDKVYDCLSEEDLEKMKALQMKEEPTKVVESDDKEDRQRAARAETAKPSGDEAVSSSAVTMVTSEPKTGRRGEQRA